jgi:CrcB protein
VSELRALLIVGAGGFVGSGARYLVGGWVHGWFPRIAFPVGTLAVNTSGCFCIGLLAALLEVRQILSPGVRLFLMIGVLGGFTTFSSFAFETLALARDAQLVRAAANVLAQVALGLLAAWLGYNVVRG